jgi:hypothetical protein
MKTMLVKWLWNSHRDFLLDRKGFRNHTIHYEDHFLRVFNEVYTARRALLGIREMHNIFRLAEQVTKIEGDMAEVGVYRGGSARIICEAKAGKRLHLFDTFEGMPEANSSIDRHQQGDFSETSLEDVKGYLSGYDDVMFYKGLFPESARDLLARPIWFSFVNLDVDLYESTAAGLREFYPRMSRGGIILSHDYRSISCPGVKQAFDEFFLDKPEPIVELWDTQCMVVKF